MIGSIRVQSKKQLKNVIEFAHNNALFSKEQKNGNISVSIDIFEIDPILNLQVKILKNKTNDITGVFYSNEQAVCEYNITTGVLLINNTNEKISIGEDSLYVLTEQEENESENALFILSGTHDLNKTYDYNDVTALRRTRNDLWMAVFCY